MIVGTRSHGRDKHCYQCRYLHDTNNDPNSFHRIRWKLYGAICLCLPLVSCGYGMRRKKEILHCSCKRSLVGSWVIATGAECQKRRFTQPGDHEGRSVSL